MSLTLLDDEPGLIGGLIWPLRWRIPRRGGPVAVISLTVGAGRMTNIVFTSKFAASVILLRFVGVSSSPLLRDDGLGYHTEP